MHFHSYILTRVANVINFISIVSNRRPYREYYVEALGESSERAWVVGKAIVVFEGRHQFEELPILRKRGKQKEKGYKHKVKFLLFCILFQGVLISVRCVAMSHSNLNSL